MVERDWGSSIHNVGAVGVSSQLGPADSATHLARCRSASDNAGRRQRLFLSLIELWSMVQDE